MSDEEIARQRYSILSSDSTFLASFFFVKTYLPSFLEFDINRLVA